MRWQWTIRKTDVITKSIRIWYMAPSHCSPQPLFQRYHCFSAPEIRHNHSLSSFPPSSPAWLKWATGVMRIVWLTLTSKKTPLRCQKLLKHGDRMKGIRAVKSKQISSWLFMLPLGLQDFLWELKVHATTGKKPSWMQNSVVCVWSDNCWASPKQVQILSRPTAKT